jgi:hypothetical protein
LVQKLQNYGVPGDFCKILKNYLSERKSCVKLENLYSQEKMTEYGVPQGSILGPILFLIYINDITNNKSNLNLTLFADDILCLVIEENVTMLMEKIQDNMNFLQKWCFYNELYINETKTNFMVFKQKNTIHQTIKLHNNNCLEGNEKCDCPGIKRVQNYKYLGVIIDENYNFDMHIEEVVKKVRRILPKLYHLKHHLNLKSKKILYESWIKPLIMYALELYGHAKKKKIDRLQKVQNKVIKLLFCDYKNKSAHMVYKKLKILKVKMLHMYMIIIKNFFELKHKRDKLQTEKVYNTKKVSFKQILTKNKFGERLKAFYIPNIFNTLPTFMWNLSSFKELKKQTILWLVKEPDVAEK